MFCPYTGTLIASWPIGMGCNPTGNPCGICQAWCEDPIAPVQAPGVISVHANETSFANRKAEQELNLQRRLRRRNKPPVLSPGQKAAVASRGSSIEPDYGATCCFFHEADRGNAPSSPSKGSHVRADKGYGHFGLNEWNGGTMRVPMAHKGAAFAGSPAIGCSPHIQIGANRLY